MRWLVVALVACAPPPIPAGPAGPPPPLTPDPAPGDADVGKPPISKPTGEPIAIAPPAFQVGVKRRHSMHSTLVIVHDGKVVQDSAKDYELDEEVLGVDGGVITKLRVAAVTSSEHMKLQAVDETKTILEGTYIVTPAAPIDVADRFDKPVIVVAREDGTPVEGWPAEALADILREEVGRVDTYIDLARRRRLRLGESVQLDDADKHLVTGSEPRTDAISLSAVARSGNLVTYQIDLARDDVRLRDRFVVDVTQGRLHEMVVTSLSADRRATSRDNETSRATVRMTYR